MNRYTIGCTPEQTCKALELGAPIKHSYDRFEDADLSPICEKENKWLYAIIPTAEQMIGWLEERDIVITLGNFRKDYGYSVSIFKNGFDISIDFMPSVNSTMTHKEATLAAIDAALEYLSNK